MTDHFHPTPSNHPGLLLGKEVSGISGIDHAADQPPSLPTDRLSPLVRPPGGDWVGGGGLGRVLRGIRRIKQARAEAEGQTPGHFEGGLAGPLRRVDHRSRLVDRRGPEPPEMGGREPIQRAPSVQGRPGDHPSSDRRGTDRIGVFA